MSKRYGLTSHSISTGDMKGVKEEAAGPLSQNTPTPPLKSYRALNDMYFDMIMVKFQPLERNGIMRVWS